MNNSISEKVGKFERRIVFSTAFDKRNPDPSKNYGIGAVRISFNLIGEKGAVSWQIGTDWYPLHCQRSMPNLSSLSLDGTKPTAWDLGYHSHKPQYENQSSRECDLLEGECFYDGSTLNAEQYIDTFLYDGPDGIWKVLERYYKDVYSEN